MHKPLRHILIILLLLVIGSPIFAQRRIIRRPGLEQRITREGAMQRVERVKEKYISQRLSLNAEEAMRFWPVYRRYQAEIAAVTVKKNLNNSAAQPDGAEQINNELNYEAQLVNIRKKYTGEFLKFMPAEKISELFKAERAFREELIRQLRERSQPNTVNAPPS